MMIRKALIFSNLFFVLIFSGNLMASESNNQISIQEQTSVIQNSDSLKWSIGFLNKLLYSCNEWYLTDSQLKKPIQGVLNYAENDPLDTVVLNLGNILKDGKVIHLMERHPQDIRNLREVPGYVLDPEIERVAEAIRKDLFDSLNNSNIVVPMMIMESELSRAPYVPDGETNILLAKKKVLPAEFVTNIEKRISSLQFPANMTGAAMDSTINQVFIAYRKVFNDSVMNRWRDKITFSYRTKIISEKTDSRIRAYKKSVADQNLMRLSSYNDRTVGVVNDSIRLALRYLIAHAEADSTLIRLANLTDSRTELWTANRSMRPIRMFLKNAQNDSLGVVLLNNRKGELKLVIDDGVKLTRFSESQNHSITFETKSPDKKLQKVNLKQVIYPPWTLKGDGSVGFTQTSLSNWAKGGESALTALIISKYTANYSKKKVKWENSAEFRYGVSKSKSRGLEKNDDKIEIQSRFGLSAFKKWYYSAESNFRTQMANGYAYPDKVNPISAFMAPGFLTFSLGLDYKPNKDFSLFLSPLTSKTTYIRDTVLIKPEKYGLLPGTNRLWEPGMIIKANWHKKLAENINYDTKGEFFNNYKYPFQKIAVEWEQVLLMQVNRFINVRVMTQMIYDYNTKFPVYNAAGTVTGQKPKLQFEELFTIGFAYKF